MCHRWKRSTNVMLPGSADSVHQVMEKLHQEKPPMRACTYTELRETFTVHSELAQSSPGERDACSVQTLGSSLVQVCELSFLLEQSASMRCWTSSEQCLPPVLSSAEGLTARCQHRPQAKSVYNNTVLQAVSDTLLHCLLIHGLSQGSSHLVICIILSTIAHYAQ